MLFSSGFFPPVIIVIRKTTADSWKVITNLALIAVNQYRMIPPIEDRDQGGADDVFGDVVEGFLEVSIAIRAG